MASLFKSLSAVSFGTLSSRILGFVRDMVTAHVFGADAMTDAFFVAFKIPNFLRRLFAEGAFSVAFVPVLTEYKEKRSFDDLKGLVDAVSGTLGLVLLAVSVFGVVFAPLVVSVFAFGWTLDGEQEKLALASDMLRLTFPYLLFISLTAFAGGVLNAHGRFAVPAFTPVFLNLALIGSALWLAPHMEQPVVALAWGVMIAGVTQFVFQLPFLNGLGLVPRFRVATQDEGVRRIVKLMIPALFGVSVVQINLLLDTVLASLLPSGSISWLYYSDRLMEFPLGILGVGLATVILPNLSKRHATDDLEAFSHTLNWALRTCVLVGLPAAVGLGVLAGPLIFTLFLSKVFDAHDASMSQLSLMAYSVGLLAFMLIKVLAPGYFARHDTKTPVRIGLKAMAVNLTFNLALIYPLQHAGLALATSIGGFANAWMLWHGLRKSGVLSPEPGSMGLMVKIAMASAAMGLAVWGANPDQAEWLAAHASTRMLWLAGELLLGIAVYAAALAALGIRPRHFREQH